MILIYKCAVVLLVETPLPSSILPQLQLRVFSQGGRNTVSTEWNREKIPDRVDFAEFIFRLWNTLASPAHPLFFAASCLRVRASPLCTRLRSPLTNRTIALVKEVNIHASNKPLLAQLFAYLLACDRYSRCARRSSTTGSSRPRPSSSERSAVPGLPLSFGSMGGDLPGVDAETSVMRCMAELLLDGCVCSSATRVTNALSSDSRVPWPVKKSSSSTAGDSSPDSDS